MATTRTKKAAKPNLIQIMTIEILPIRSDYDANSWARVRALLTFRLNPEEGRGEGARTAMAACHRLAADLLEAMPPAKDWCAPQVEECETFGTTTKIKVAMDLLNGTDEEMERAKALLTEVTNRLPVAPFRAQPVR